MDSKLMSWFRWIGYAEGLSFLVLLGIAMPLKYAFGMPLATRVIGMAHGILFMVYVALATAAARHQAWPSRVLWRAYIASVLPFGTFVFQKKYGSYHG